MITQASKKLENFLIIGLPLISLTVTRRLNFDPANLPKLVTLSVVAFGALITSATFLFRQKAFLRIPLLLSLVFLISFSLSFLLTNSPKVQAFFGVQGRNTGFLAYISFVFIFLASSTFKNQSYFKRIILAFLFAFTTNVIYCFLQIFGIDLIGWNNIYKTILGTFGNPNFISAFLAMGVAAALPLLLSKGIKKPYRLILIGIIGIAIFEIVISKAIQGIVVTAMAFYMAIYFRYFKSRLYKALYLCGGLIIAAVSLFGVLQIGPLSAFLYKNSVTLRGFYWNAGLKMFMSHPVLGIGPDSYGDWYMRSRSDQSVLPPGGYLTLTNSAHNVFIDILASVGLFGFLAYLGIVIYCYYLIFTASKNGKLNDPIFQSLTIAFSAYILQSIVSINQIGLGVWGWAFAGTIISYVKFGSESNLDNAVKTKTNINDFDGIKISLGIILGFVLSFPALKADIDWYTAYKSREINKVIEVSKQWPKDSRRLAEISVLFDNNKLPENSREINKIAIGFNPDYFDAWRGELANTLATEKERKEAIKNLHRLDPLNPDWQ